MGEDDDQWRFDSSEDEEQLALHTKPKPKPRLRPKAKAAHKPKPAPAPPRAESCTMAHESHRQQASADPDYNSWSLPLLQREVAKYGFRTTVERSVLVQQLERVREVLNPAAAGNTPQVKTRAPSRKGKEKEKAGKECGSGDERQEESLGERLRLAIVGDEVLYSRVLRYEPVYFDEFVALATEKGIKCARPMLMQCLDEQCITFYTQDPTSGTRKRYR